MIGEVGIRLQLIVMPIHRPPSLLILFENAHQSFREIIGDFFQRAKLPGTGRVLYFKILSIIVMKPLKRFDKEIIYRKPNRAAPIGISAKQGVLAFSRRVLHAEFISIGVELIGLRMLFGQGTYSVIG